MTVRILDALGEFVELTDVQADLLFREMKGANDPSVSSCVTCRSCVVATEPFTNVLDEMSVTYVDESDVITQLSELAENSELVHLYILEDNDCVHKLWRDPLAGEWSAVTGEKRLHS